MSRFEIFCHGCDVNTFGLQDANDELNCEDCGGSFVEIRGQAGLSSFQDQDMPSTAELDADGDEIPALAALSDILLSSSTNGTSSTRNGLSGDNAGTNQRRRTTGTSTSTNSQSSTNTARTQTHASTGTSTQIPPHLRTMAQMLGMQSGQMGGGIMSMGAIGVSATGQVLHSSNFSVGGQPQMSPFGPFAGPGPTGMNPIEALLSQFIGAGGMPFGLNPGAPGDAISDILHHILVNESSHAGAPPASDTAIEALELVDVTAENQEELGCCYITQDNFDIGDKALKLKCGHHFQPEGIKQWLKMHNTCPVCREPVHTEAEARNLAAAAAAAAAASTDTNASTLSVASDSDSDSDSSMSLPELITPRGSDSDELTREEGSSPTGLPNLVPLSAHENWNDSASDSDNESEDAVYSDN